MAVIYLRSTDGNDADDGSTWALAKATLAAALVAAGAGGTVYVSQAHAESQASAMTLSSPGTPGSPVKVLCVSDAAEPPTALTTGASVSTTGANAITIGGVSTTNGTSIYQGITITAGSGATAAALNIGVSGSNINCIMMNCKLALGTTAAASRFALSEGTRGAQVLLINTTLKFGAVGQGIRAGKRVIWQDTPSAIDLTGSTPTTLVLPTGQDFGIIFRSVDLSALGSGNNLVSFVANGGVTSTRLINCLLGASVNILTGTLFGPGEEVLIDNCDSADTNYRMEHYKYQGSIKTETSITRSGGASDGTTPISWAMASLAGASFASPLASPPIAIWNDTTGSAKTITVEIAIDNAGTALTEADIWLEIEYPGTASSTLSSFATDHNSTLLAPSTTDQTASSATWNNMTNPTRQTVAVTVTPQEKGWMIGKIMLAKPSTTVYVDPVMVVS